VADFDPNTPSIARVYDLVLGGKDNFAADREFAARILEFLPLVPVVALENRQFLSRAVTWAANQGISQFIDLGCGLPTAPNTHETARAIIGDARVVYVDSDPVVINHLRAMVAKRTPGVTVVDSDVRDVATILDAARAHLDLSEPVGLIAGALLHFFPAEAARGLLAGFKAALAPGSCLAISAFQAVGAESDEGLSIYSSTTAPVYNHPVAELASFFAPFDLVPPGLVDVRRWRPDWKLPDTPPREFYGLAGVARKRSADGPVEPRDRSL
jgi:O-methyltransferase involved in polyketide biosynthesis